MHSCSIIKLPKGVCGILPHLLVKKYTFSKLAEDSFYIMVSGLPNLSENYFPLDPKPLLGIAIIQVTKLPVRPLAIETWNAFLQAGLPGADWGLCNQ
jgi:hypothetical protein